MKLRRLHQGWGRRVPLRQDGQAIGGVGEPADAGDRRGGAGQVTNRPVAVGMGGLTLTGFGIVTLGPETRPDSLEPRTHG